jgi:hypothetical protein
MPTIVQVVATSSLVSAVVSAAINAGTTAYRDRRTRRVSARLSALSIVGVMETWINTAYDMMIGLSSVEQMERFATGELGLDEWIGAIPELPAWPDTVDWHALEVEGSLSVINFANSVRMACSAALPTNNPYLPDAQAKLGLYTSQLILEAMTLVEGLRTTWKLDGWRSIAYADIKEEAIRLVAQYTSEREAIARRTSGGG